MKINKPNNDQIFIYQQKDNSGVNDIKGSQDRLLGFSNNSSYLDVSKEDATAQASETDFQKGIIPGVKFTSDGKVDASQFSLDELKKAYPEDKYQIYPVGAGYQVSKKDGEAGFAVILDGNGEVEDYCQYNPESFIRYEAVGGKVFASIEFVSDGTMISKIYNDEGKLHEEVYLDGDNRVRKIIKYCKDGSVLSIVQNSPDGEIVKGEFPFVDKIIKGLNSGDSDLLVVAENIFDNVNEDNISELWADYFKKTGNTLIFDIYNSPLAESLKNKLCSHIEDVRFSAMQPLEAAGFVYSNMTNANEMQDVGLMDYTMTLISPENVAELFAISGKNNNLSSGNSILEVISNLEWLSQKKKDEYINHIIESVLERKSGVYLDDIKEDITAHRHDARKLSVDLVRAINRVNSTKEAKISKPNGKLDGSVEQGNAGDCWLISGIYGCYQRSKGAQILESIVRQDAKTGNYVVTLRREGKPYPIEITLEEVKNANYLSSGDGDMRVWELAFDKFLKEQAYISGEKAGSIDSNGAFISNHYDITGDNLNLIASYIFGKETSIGVDFLNEDFNNENRVYQLSVPFKELIENVYMYTVNAQDAGPQKMIPNHALVIIGSDEKNIFLVNSHDTSMTYSISRQKLEEIEKVSPCSLVEYFDIEP